MLLAREFAVLSAHELPDFAGRFRRIRGGSYRSIF